MGCSEEKISTRKGSLALLGLNDRLFVFFFGWMDETVMPKFKVLINFLLFFTFLKMVLSSVFNFISAFFVYKFFSLLQF